MGEPARFWIFRSREKEYNENSGAALILLLFLDPVLGTTGNNLDQGLLEPDNFATLPIGL